MLDSLPVTRLQHTLSKPAARVAARTFTVGWMAVIFAMSSVPGGAVPGRFGNLAHVLEYAVLGAALYAALRRAGRDARAAAVAILVAAAYAVTDEYHQTFVPGRVADVADWGLDVLGASFGALALRHADTGKTA